MTKILTKEIVDKMSDNEILDWVLVEIQACKRIAPQSELSRRIMKIRLRFCGPHAYGF